MDILKIGTELLANKLGGNIDQSVIESALTGLIGNNSGSLDISGLVSNMMENGSLQQMVGSWLGDGSNDAISSSQISEALGQDKISSFASNLDIDDDTASFNLAEIIPQLIDQSSSSGSMLDSIGGLDGLTDLAKKLF